MNSFIFLTWIIRSRVFDISEEGCRRKNQAEKKNKNLYFKYVHAHACTFM